MSQVNNPLHGVTLEQIVTALVDHFGWPGLAKQVDINCFKVDPSVKSSLKFYNYLINSTNTNPEIILLR